MLLVEQHGARLLELQLQRQSWGATLHLERVKLLAPQCFSRQPLEQEPLATDAVQKQELYNNTFEGSSKLVAVRMRNESRSSDIRMAYEYTVIM
jgi:hypothetical protein